MPGDPGAVLLDYQALMVDSFRTFFAKECPTARVRHADDTHGFDHALWTRFGELGGPLASVAEPHGGGGSLLDALLVGMEAGRCLAPIGYADAVTAFRLAERVAGADWPALAPGESWPEPRRTPSPRANRRASAEAPARPGRVVARALGGLPRQRSAPQPVPGRACAPGKSHRPGLVARFARGKSFVERSRRDFDG